MLSYFINLKFSLLPGRRVYNDFRQRYHIQIIKKEAAGVWSKLGTNLLVRYFVTVSNDC